MTTPTKPAQKPKLPDKLRMVPPRKFRPLREDEIPREGDAYDRFKSLQNDGLEAFLETAAWLGADSPMANKPIDPTDRGFFFREVIRPLSQPKRAEKAKTAEQIAESWVTKGPYDINADGTREMIKSAYLAGFRAGYRAANRRAKPLGLPVVPKAKKGRT